ncbi:hypothetical protein IEQ34_020166 [Dendrobium chrysotoxum]|uniref:LAGLIDADG homing endonuclease n=1 Tax=Dendrobium chrysotoxum TaxID=161865 RepID=A0AAV7FKH0_DENCH|nr:hypothetical protein IEQ34_020166 [Dendrobium chrysotoxum]
MKPKITKGTTPGRAPIPTVPKSMATEKRSWRGRLHAIAAISADLILIPYLLESKNQCLCDKDSTTLTISKHPTKARPLLSSLCSRFEYHTNAYRIKGETAMSIVEQQQVYKPLYDIKYWKAMIFNKIFYIRGCNKKRK